MTAEVDSRAWDFLATRIDALVTAWETAGDMARANPPRLEDYLPPPDDPLWRFTLVELAKVDLEYRWRVADAPKQVEDYGREFPRLAADGKYPTDLICEEFHIRRQLGQAIRADDILARFPQQREELAALLRDVLPGAPDANATSTFQPKSAIARYQAGDRVDDFDLLAELGEGSFAKVFLARQRSMQRMVALKVSAIRGEEHKTLAQLDHPHIVRVYSQLTLEAENIRLLYMQYLPGGTLHKAVSRVRETDPHDRRGDVLVQVVKESLESRGESPASEHQSRWKRLASQSWSRTVCWLGAKLASALAYAHDRGVLHRDIKPANVLLAGDGSPKLADFNISFSSAVQGSSPAAYFGGSLAYMSPEQLEACNPRHARKPEELDGRSDVYSLGVLLWELLTGERPFRDPAPGGYGVDVFEEMIARRQAGLTQEALTRLPGDLPPGLADVLKTCLAPDRDERFESAALFARQLELCLQPHVQALLRPRPTPWSNLVFRHATPTLLLVAVAPNLAMSLVNIAYNRSEIVRLSEHDLMLVNAIVYPIGLLSMYLFVRPVGRTAARRATRQPIAPDELELARRRSLWIGDFSFAMGLLLWIVSGVIFPAGVHIATGQMPLKNYVHFATSHLMCGTIAGTVVFFLTTQAVVRHLFPRLIDPNREDEASGQNLLSLARRTMFHYALAVSLPLVAVLVAVFFTANKGAYAGLAIIGLAAVFMAWKLSARIRSDTRALLLATSPDDVPLADSAADDSWLSSSFHGTGSRRGVGG